MKPITVSQLKKELQRLERAGKGDYAIFLSDDEECNGFHGLWEGATAIDEIERDDRAFLEENNYDLHALDDVNKAVYLN